MRRTGLALMTVAISVALGVVSSEALLRLMGRGPLVFRGRSDAEPSYRPHLRLGWVHAPGVFEVAGAQATFLEDGSRATSARSELGAGRTLVLVGGSFTEGYGVADEETFAWLLQERRPDVSVRNFGTGGHGTLQALYRLEEQLPALRANGAGPVTVAYGYMWHHPVRNVAHASWREQLNAQSWGMPGREVRIPYALLDGDRGLRHFPPTPWPALRWCERSALAYLAVQQWVRFRTRDRLPQAGPVTGAIVGEMERLAREGGARFMFVQLLSAHDHARYVRENLARQGIAHVDCRIGGYADPRYRDPETGHPTALAHERYADCIGRALGW